MRRTLKWLLVMCVVMLVPGGSAVALAEARAEIRRDTPQARLESRSITRDVLVKKIGLTPKQADKVIKVHRQQTASIAKAQEKYRLQVEKIRKREQEQLAKIVSKEQLARLQRALKQEGRRPAMGRAPRSETPESRGPGSDITQWQEWLTRLKNLTPEQKEKLKDLMESHRQQLRTLQERFRKGLQDILTSDQMEKLRSRFENMPWRKGSPQDQN